MFKFLREKLRNSVALFSKKIEESGEEVVEEVEKPGESDSNKERENLAEQKPAVLEEKKEKKGFLSRLFRKKDEPSIVEKIDRLLEPKEETKEAEQEEKKVRPEPPSLVPEPVIVHVSDDQQEMEAPQNIEAFIEQEAEKPQGETAELYNKAAEEPPEEEISFERPELGERSAKGENKIPKQEEYTPEEGRSETAEHIPEESAGHPETEQKQPDLHPSMSAQELIDSPFEELLKNKPVFDMGQEPVQEQRIGQTEPSSPLEETDGKCMIPADAFQKPEEIEKQEMHGMEDKAPENQQAEKKGFFGMLKEKIISKKISEEKFEEMFWDLEVTLLENNVAMQVIEKIRDDLKKDIVEKPMRRNKIEETIILTLKKSIDGVLSSPAIDLLQEMQKKKPYVICFVGINGSGKTTTIAKIANMLLKSGKKVVVAAADTFRAAAIDQLQIHADNLGVKLIRHEYCADPAAVAFDAIQYGQAKGIDAVLIDTAGRLHSNANLIDEMKKIARVAKPDLKLFVGEAITGNDCIEQAEKFNEAIGIDGIILAKADIDEKGAASISVSYVTKKPVLFMGTGQGYDDLKPFDKNEIISSLGLEA